MTHTRKQLPKYCLHKSTGRAYVRIDGKMYYLGKHGSQASRREYDRIIGEFIANGRQSFQSQDGILIEQLICRFLDYMEVERNYHPKTNDRITAVLRLLNELYGKTPVSQFGPAALKAIRRRYLDSGLCRRTINGYIWIIVRVFSWGCEEEIVPAEVAGALRMVSALKAGQTAAIEYDDIEPVDDDIVEKTLPHIKYPLIQDMVRVQRLICGRPQDMFNMRPCDIDRSQEIWKYMPYTHKTQHRGKVRMLPIGPKAQEILQKYLDKCGDEDFVFPQLYPQWYYCHIASACDRAGVPRWTPNQLRHTGATEVREKYGLEYTQSVLGHSSAKITEIYAKASYEKAEKVAREIG